MCESTHATGRPVSSMLTTNSPSPISAALVTQANGLHRKKEIPARPVMIAVTHLQESPVHGSPRAASHPVQAAPGARGWSLVFTVENITDKLLPFRFNSGQNFDFVIREAAGDREVWRWSRDQFFTQVIRSEAIRGNGKWTFEATWNGRDNDGQPVLPGEYLLHATLTADPLLQASPISITVP